VLKGLLIASGFVEAEQRTLALSLRMPSATDALTMMKEAFGANNAVGASLRATLKHFLGPSWAPELASTLAQAYGLVTKVMVAAADQHEDIAPAYWYADVIGVERCSVEVAGDRGCTAVGFPYRAGQSVAVEIPQRPRLWRYFSPANAPQPSGRL
jgi:hypothetical protein